MMTSQFKETEQTNEFLRRRKLRLLQVREQSKDIAKKIRQRVRVEKLRQVVNIDAKKQAEYLQQQEKFVKHLEQQYAQGLDSVGTSHRNASELRNKDLSPSKRDLSKLRGKEAAAELKRKNQEKLDLQKKQLDRKLQAREAANELSREKSTTSNKLLTKVTTKGTEDFEAKSANDNSMLSKDNDNNNPNNDKEAVRKTDMATQWEFDRLPNEWEPNIPILSLPKEDSIKESNINLESKSDKSKRLDLFACSDDMPPSLRGSLVNIPAERLPVKPPLTLVTEYLRSKGRLREPEISTSKKKNFDDLHSLKQTILRSRLSKPDNVSAKSSNERSKSSAPDSGLTKKNLISVYNHTTKGCQDIPCSEEKLVVREDHIKEDAYSQAIKESSTGDKRVKEDQIKLQEMRHKVAMTKQSVEKEYTDTMIFLNSFSENKTNKPIKKAYMDDRRQQMQKENLQHKMQQEYNKIEKECRKHCHRKSAASNKSCRKSKSPTKENLDDFVGRDFQYSWMPVPESDGNLTVHTIPTTVKQTKCNNVKFSKVDSYHEYRSRHKHTPPTKDVSDKIPNKKTVEAVYVQGNDSTSYSSVSSDSHSVEDLRLVHDSKTDQVDKQLDAERIIIYKILDSKIDKNKARKKKIVNEIAQSLSTHGNGIITSQQEDNIQNTNASKNVVNKVSFEEIDEGVFKTVNGKGDNISSMLFSDNPRENTNVNHLTEDKSRNYKPCQCIKSDRKEYQDKDVNLSWESGDKTVRTTTEETTVTHARRCRHTDASKELIHDSVVQSSGATSNSSFKTATNDKADMVAKAKDGGYVKFIDEVGHEAGKFYIGASAFLKDDAYEVVIQLRKKDGKEDPNKEHEPIEKSSTSVPTTDKKSNESVTTVKNMVANKNLSAFHSYPDKGSFKITSDIITTNPVKSIEKEVQETVGSVINLNDEVIKSTHQDKEVCDKSVVTSFQSYVLPNEVPKSDPITRPATSTYTQTTFSSPNQRPVFFHTSSSTSTAYMSPPDIILPKFLRHEYRTDDDDTYEHIRSIHSENGKIEYSDQHHRACKCRSREHVTKVTLCKNKKHCNKRTKVQVPPNTARSYSGEYKTHNDISKRKDAKDIDLKCKKTRCKYHKHGDLSYSNGHSKNKGNFNTKRSASSSKQSSGNIVGSSAASSYRSKVTKAVNKNSKCIINPTIKNYVNKLLVMNKQSLKAIEVVEQECSSVTTPESTIINEACNKVDNKNSSENKISLEQIKTVLMNQILKGYTGKTTDNPVSAAHRVGSNGTKKNLQQRSTKKKVHKVKSLNVSKQLMKPKIERMSKTSICSSKSKFTSSFVTQKAGNVRPSSMQNKVKYRSKSSPTPRQSNCTEVARKSISSDIVTKRDISEKGKTSNIFGTNTLVGSININRNTHRSTETDKFISPRPTILSTSPDVDIRVVPQTLADISSAISTQTCEDINSNIHFMNIAESKPHNMEKIADLTEQCTKRLSNLAKVLEEVRRNKSLAYSQVSTPDSTSDSDQKSGVITNKSPLEMYEPSIDRQKKVEASSPPITKGEEEDRTDSSEYVPFLSNIPKPTSYKLTSLNANLKTNDQTDKQGQLSVDQSHRSRRKPPPALSTRQLKYGQDVVIPHELSTVIEVDSPMSVKYKNLSRNDTKGEISYYSNNEIKEIRLENNVVDSETRLKGSSINPDLVQSNRKSLIQVVKLSSTDSSDDSKLKMMDLKQFNEIMLQPFISIQEYAKQCNVDTLHEVSNAEDIPEDDVINDDISSLHSEGSLPDVIAELLKRKMISEPFKFDTVSNVNSTSVSSESTLSMLALSKVKKDKKISNVHFQNKENVAETSDTLSISSNPDLEHAFKNLGMGWASSTLKKTKERLALSSSSNTSSSNAPQFNLNGMNTDKPVLPTDSVSAVLNLSRKSRRNIVAGSKNVEMQTSLINSMTVKEFLKNELANKITFSNKSNINDSEEQFVSLYETKMPEEFKHSSQVINVDGSLNNSVPSGNNRARTSTPVQIYKSMSYRSSSSSNMSNGLFSNADDLSSVKETSNSMKNHSTSDKDDLTIPNLSLRLKKNSSCSKSD